MMPPADPLALYEVALNLPRTHELLIPENFIDSNGHMNVMYYTGVGNMGIKPFFKLIGIPDDKIASGERGFFALKQVISYLNELRLGEHVALHTGLVNYDRKRIHLIHHIVNLTRKRVACIDERVAMYMDLKVRRSTEFEPETLEKLKGTLANFNALNWQPQVSGAIQLTRIEN
ncbi:thioesterase family protein [Candidatus Chlorohelix sp.]|uniref:thioesterase family protein n=1 Tax=Candidatus Chlorohelix sp. TaxID=3139201 RepID=UPI0030320F3D